MDPYGEICDECRISDSQEEILCNLISEEFQDALGVLSSDDSPTPSNPGILICSIPESPNNTKTISLENHSPLVQPNNTPLPPPNNLGLLDPPHNPNFPLFNNTVFPAPEDSSISGNFIRVSDDNPLKIKLKLTSSNFPCLVDKDPIFLEDTSTTSSSAPQIHPPVKIPGFLEPDMDKIGVTNTAVAVVVGCRENSPPHETFDSKSSNVGKDSVLWENTANKCGFCVEKSPAIQNLGLPEPENEILPDANNANGEIAVGGASGRLSNGLSRQGIGNGNADSSIVSRCDGDLGFGRNSSKIESLASAKSQDEDLMRKSLKSPEHNQYNVATSEKTCKNIGHLQKALSSILTCEESTQVKLIQLLNALSEDSDGDGNEDAGCVDILEVAEKAGYKFHRPRWWPAGDEF